jgi:hypothetical protein
MSQSRSGKPDLVLEGLELLFQQKGDQLVLALSFEWTRSKLYELNCGICL